jgi:hypothetical protein
MIGTLRRHRSVAIAVAAAAALTASAVAAQPAHATRNDSCGRYIYGWNYWNQQLYLELAPSNGDAWSAYAEYCMHQVIAYEDLVSSNNC